jgi:hypothetical protein
VIGSVGLGKSSRRAEQFIHSGRKMSHIADSMGSNHQLPALERPLPSSIAYSLPAMDALARHDELRPWTHLLLQQRSRAWRRRCASTECGAMQSVLTCSP